MNGLSGSERSLPARVIAIVAIAIAATGCIGPLDPASIVKTPRILAIVADRPEAAPGEDVAFTAMISIPEDVPRPLSLRWRVCLDAESVLDETGFAVDVPGPPTCDEATTAVDAPFRVDGTRTDALVEQLRGFAMLGGFDPALFEAVLFTAGLAYVVDLEVLDAEGTVRVAGYKRGAITLRMPPTTNPPAPAFRVGEASVAATEVPFACAPLGDAITVPPDVDVELEPLLPDGATEEDWLETFPIFDYTGGLTVGSENAYYTWYATDGSLSEETTQPPNLATTWHTPAVPGPYTLWLVIRDGHLGTSACRLDVVVE